MTKTLFELARAATPGPWFAINDGTDDEPMISVKAARITGQPPRHCVALCCTGDSVQEMENANADFIAAANPKRIIELCEAAEEVLRISDRKHNAWDRLRRALKGE